MRLELQIIYQLPPSLAPSLRQAALLDKQGETDRQKTCYLTPVLHIRFHIITKIIMDRKNVSLHASLIPLSRKET